LTIIRVLLGALTIVVLALSWVDPDLWGHVRYGLDLITARQLLEDSYSFTSDIEWVNHEWLSEVIFGAAYLSGGSAGLILLKLALALGTVIVSMRGVWRSGRDATIQDALLAILIAGIWIRIYVIRPQLFSLLLFAVLMWICQAADNGAIRRLAWLPLVFCLWVNMHGGWVVGAGMLMLWAAASALTSTRVSNKTIALTVAASAAATLVNPYGFEMWGFLAETVRPGRPWIDDWRPLLATPALLPFWLPVAAAAAFGLWRARRTIPLSHTLIVAALAVASVRVSRLDAFFAIATVTLLGPTIAGERARHTQATPDAHWKPALPVAIAAAILAAAAAATPAFRCVSMQGLDWLPEPEVVPAIRAGALHGRMITWFGWGQYAIWHLSPEVKVSFDGRRETVYSERFGDNHVRLYWTPEQAGDFLDGLDAELAWLPKELPLSRFLENAGWFKVFEGPRSIVLSRAAREGLPQAAAAPAGRCFPGP
jgi:hypothetical protein